MVEPSRNSRSVTMLDSFPHSHPPSHSHPPVFHHHFSSKSLSKMAQVSVSTHPEVSTALFTHPLVDQATSNEAIVDFDGAEDPYRPMNWSFRKKVATTILYGFTTGWITFASAIYAAVVAEICREFHVDYEVATLGTSLFVVGFALGPLIFAPLSELYGRKPAVLIVSGSNPFPFTPAHTNSLSPAIFCCCGILVCDRRGEGHSDGFHNAFLRGILWQRPGHHDGRRAG